MVQGCEGDLGMRMEVRHPPMGWLFCWDADSGPAQPSHNPLYCREALTQPSSSFPHQQQRPRVSTGQCLVKAETATLQAAQGQGQGQEVRRVWVFPGSDIRREGKTKLIFGFGKEDLGAEAPSPHGAQR